MRIIDSLAYIIYIASNINFIMVMSYVGQQALLFKVRETIYILGLGMPGLRPPTEGEEPPIVLKVHSFSSLYYTTFVIFPQEISPASSIISIFGFGHDGTGKWTFAGRRQILYL